MTGIPFRGWSLLCAFVLLSVPLPVRGQQPLAVNTAANPIGRLISAGNGQIRRFYEYDALGRAVRTEHRLDSGGYVFATTFGYPQGSGTTGLGTVPRTQSFPDGEAVAYGYDASGVQRTITATRPGTVTPQDVVRDIRRNARGETISVTYGNGVVSTHSYNDTTDLRLNRIQTTNGTGLVQDYLYGFDANGNVTSLADGIVPSFSATYGYDSLDRLASMTSGSAFSYQYDSVGNLINKEGTVQTYGGTGRGPHALAGAGGTAYTYDFNGNVASTSAGLALTWNAENMATLATLGGVTQNRKSFLHEELWKKVEGGTTTLYLPSLLLENGVPRKFFGAFAERSPDGTLKFYHGDHLGSSSVVTDASQAVIHRIAYMPYGTDRGVAGGSFIPRYQFNFKEKESTGLYDYGARLYNPATGRWLSADSEQTDGPNRYAYVSNNPLIYVDPTGHFEMPTWEKHIPPSGFNEAVELAADLARGKRLIDRAVRRGEDIAFLAQGIDHPDHKDMRNRNHWVAATGLGKKQVISVTNSHWWLQAMSGKANEGSAKVLAELISYALSRGIDPSRMMLFANSNGIPTLSRALTLLNRPISPAATILLAPNTSQVAVMKNIINLGGGPHMLVAMSNSDPMWIFASRPASFWTYALRMYDKTVRVIDATPAGHATPSYFEQIFKKFGDQ